MLKRNWQIKITFSVFVNLGKSEEFMILQLLSSLIWKVSSSWQSQWFFLSGVKKQAKTQSDPSVGIGIWLAEQLRQHRGQQPSLFWLTSDRLHWTGSLWQWTRERLLWGKDIGRIWFSETGLRAPQAGSNSMQSTVIKLIEADCWLARTNGVWLWLCGSWWM